ncbi:hypothetical protein [Acinetobacter baumannii]|uniref:hypothetical protein n=1 Tax=Acinetobacter baumannii TaxID=470 RepID=UPI000BF3E1E0|nr:hypothetical protein [Acinetobacter baumannii]MCL6167087.1 hypothetical protein [Acinetobacter baumannii]MCL6170830.1 hypothetical protein [Acinetobacter baumannii]MCL6174216.1 hypothetical protein [Acinetobacter baumannii]MCL6195061.1 hypothetical protein [Acinetobacter baumannii]MCL6198525.1 hypothetical protein [Acinetobacter baumannii]
MNTVNLPQVVCKTNVNSNFQALKKPDHSQIGQAFCSLALKKQMNGVNLPQDVYRNKEGLRVKSTLSGLEITEKSQALKKPDSVDQASCSLNHEKLMNISNNFEEFGI